MPYYDYKCSKCGRKFNVKETFEEHGRKRVKCPKCASQKVERVFGAVMAKTSKKS